MLADERPDLFDRLAVLGDHLDAERDAAGPMHAPSSATPAPRRSLVPVVAAVVITVLGLAALTQLDRSDESAQQPSASTPAKSAVPGATSPGSSATTDVTTTETAPSPVLPPDAISWTRASDPGSIARSQVSRVVAGPGGFVAIGMGFDDGQNQGRVWHSSDGLTWEEPAFDLFDSKQVGSIAATAEAYFVVAGTNPDRLGLGEGASSPDIQLFRSADGTRWEPWGEPWGNNGDVTSTDNVLLRSPEPGLLEWSADGIEWSIAAFGDSPVDGAYFDVWGGVIRDGETAYLRGFAADEVAVWSSTDGRSWQQLPTPPAGGTIAGVPGGIVLITNPREQECAALTNPTADAQWTCTAEPDVYRFNADSATWSLDAHHLADTPVIPSVARLSNTLVAPLIEPSKALTIWTAPVDTLEWTEQTPTRLAYIDNTGSPGMAAIAASENTVVVFTEDRIVDEQTAIIVGITQLASE
jgi:hypothetical protein